ncbi:hypothetical protein [Sagittula stellata]|uniref:hypothetical protein n=1 Tax=Sagittula stellata TaxID=52603 RepID=UPI0032193E59
MRFVKLSPAIHRKSSQLYFSFSPQRSGQHLVIDWLCRGLDDILHVNHARLRRRGLFRHIEPLAGRVVLYKGEIVTDTGRIELGKLPPVGDMTFRKEFWSAEDICPLDPSYRDFGGSIPQKAIVILRDPANWLASTFRMGRWAAKDFERKVGIYRQTLQFCLENRGNPQWSFICFNDFVSSPDFRKALSTEFADHDLSRAERALDEVPDFGGGSSFSGLSDKVGTSVQERWHAYIDDPDFLRLLRTPDLRPLSKSFFGRDYLHFLD